LHGAILAAPPLPAVQRREALGPDDREAPPPDDRVEPPPDDRDVPDPDDEERLPDETDRPGLDEPRLAGADTRGALAPERALLALNGREAEYDDVPLRPLGGDHPRASREKVLGSARGAESKRREVATSRRSSRERVPDGTVAESRDRSEVRVRSERAGGGAGCDFGASRLVVGSLRAGGGTSRVPDSLRGGGPTSRVGATRST